MYICIYMSPKSKNSFLFLLNSLCVFSVSSFLITTRPRLVSSCCHSGESVHYWLSSTPDLMRFGPNISCV